MEFREIIRLIAPIVLIIFGLVMKNSTSERFDATRKYWLLFVIGGSLMLAFRLYKFL